MTFITTTVQNWWRQGMMGSAKAHQDGVGAFSETDQTEDRKATTVLHGEDDQIVPINTSAHRAIRLLANGTLKTYPRLSHGMLAVNVEVLNKDLLAFMTC